MAKAGVVYPQVEHGAAALADRRIARSRPGVSAEAALALCRRADARAILVGGRRVVLAADLSRAVAVGLGRVAASRLARGPVPVVAAGATEVEVRRHVLAGAPMVLVREGGCLLGLIERGAAAMPGDAPSLVARLDRAGAPPHEAALSLLRRAGALGDEMRAPVFAVGGFVRDLLLGRRAPDIDLVVEGDGIALARRLAEATGGALTAHPAFGTASIAGARLAGGGAVPRVDVASARRERYVRPGALPIVEPAPLAEDLARRDFSINAMAMALGPSTFGRLVDPLGGRHDLRRRALRPLHPLSFVDDPTRLFRGARYAARLGCRLGTDGRAARDLARAVADFPDLSGDRLRAEIELMAAEPDPVAAFDLLLRWQVPDLFVAGYRRVPGARGFFRAAVRFSEVAARAGLDVDRGDAAAVALLAGQPAPVVSRALDRLALRGEPRRMLAAAVTGDAPARLAVARTASAAADVLRPLSAPELAGAFVRGGARTRRRIEWFLDEGRRLQPRLSGADLLAAGVPAGPAVGASLAELRRLRLDGRVKTVDGEWRRVKQWLRTPDPGGRPGAKGGLR